MWGVNYYLIMHRCLKIETSIVTLRAVTARDEIECYYSSERYDTSFFRQRCFILFIKHMSNNYSLDYLSILHRLQKNNYHVVQMVVVLAISNDL